MFSVFSSFNICACCKLLFFFFSPSLLLLFALQTAALTLPRWVAVPSETHFTKLLPCGLYLGNASKAQTLQTGLGQSGTGGRIHRGPARQGLTLLLLRVIAEGSRLIYFKVCKRHNSPGGPPRLLNTSPLVAGKVILQRGDKVATGMLAPSVGSAAAWLSFALTTRVGVLALTDDIARLPLGYAPVPLAWD